MYIECHSVTLILSERHRLRFFPGHSAVYFVAWTLGHFPKTTMLGALLFEAQFRHGNTNFRGTDFEVWCELSYYLGSRHILSSRLTDWFSKKCYNHLLRRVGSEERLIALIGSVFSRRNSPKLTNLFVPLHSLLALNTNCRCCIRDKYLASVMQDA